MFKIELGSYVEDIITGFKGYVTGRADYVTGCNTYLVQPDNDKGKNVYPDNQWIDEHRLKVNSKKKKIQLEESKDDGADIEAPSK